MSLFDSGEFEVCKRCKGIGEVFDEASGEMRRCPCQSLPSPHAPPFKVDHERLEEKRLEGEPYRSMRERSGVPEPEVKEARGLTYEDFISDADAGVYKRVKWVSMHLARIGREEVVSLLRERGCDARIGDPVNQSGKQFVVTPRGIYRLTFGTRSDNSTELAAHVRMGVHSIDFSSEINRREFWSWHLPGAQVDEEFVTAVRTRVERGRNAS
jgi:hypothetical protein